MALEVVAKYVLDGGSFIRNRDGPLQDGYLTFLIQPVVSINYNVQTPLYRTLSTQGNQFQVKLVHGGLWHYKKRSSQVSNSTQL
jgi:hypothetical protein